ncbi:beta-L-arabinofuranosidase domain-containing protein [Paenibacillus sp. NFR01]|uniref:glycoside hydrolase family 127 protein n=1 Tax=Paenibacillus sp. NFR01 TaxID=1566279 RepID=UPI0008B205DC|nr:beta-L-arabinofuranosidase domain-containing protein [Paenibacillus sp. NFR01]SEU20467.1 hypothetical protein SAMN03159358_3984 [Paenibacillus sp. NFR01]
MKEQKLKQHPLNDFALDRVQLTAEYQGNAFARELDYLLSYVPDRLLAGFREVAGMKPKAKIYPGWENTEIRGHTLGHYLKACAQAYAQSRNEEIYAKLEYLLQELAACQLDSGYLSAFPETLIDNVEQKRPAWVPWYTMHKIIAGLIAVHEATGLQTAFAIVSRLGDWVADRTSGWDDEMQATVLAVEYGGMNDCLYDLYKITGNPRHLEAAHQFDELPLFQAVYEGKDVLQGKHANTMIPKFVGALNRYLTLGESESFYYEAARRFWDTVVYHHSYMTGGNSESEHFGAPDLLDAKRSDITCETCNSYNMLKLTRELFKLTRDIKYADFYETTYVNAILSSQNPETGMTMYFQPMATGYFKVYSSPFNHFWCCTGTGMESFTKLNDSLYFQQGHHLYLNQYISSRLDWQEQHAVLQVAADLPYSDEVRLTLELPEAVDSRLALHLRIPYWARTGISVTVNGAEVPSETADGYALIERIWRHGDEVRLRLPMQPFYSPLPDAPNVAGFQYGPVVLSAALGAEDLRESRTGIDVSIPTMHRPVKDYIIPQGMTPEEWFAGFERHFVRRAGEPLAFELRGTDEDERLVFTPHYKQHQERYGIYWRFLAPGSSELQAHLDRSAREQRLREATLDSVQVGNDQYELEHQVQGERTYAGTWEGQNGRRAEAGGWFSYALKVLPEGETTLAATFGTVWDSGVLELRVDGRTLATEAFEGSWRRNFREVLYPLPAEWTEGRTAVTVSFHVTGPWNGIYGVLRTLSAKHLD